MIIRGRPAVIPFPSGIDEAGVSEDAFYEVVDSGGSPGAFAEGTEYPEVFKAGMCFCRGSVDWMKGRNSDSVPDQ